jgi:hypothetical protein
VYGSHLLRPEDLGGAAGTEGAVRDEHNRPLRLMYGFVTPLPLTGPPDPADLTAALAVALPEYQRFLADENRTGVTASAAFALRSPVSVAVGTAPVPRAAAVADRPATAGGPVAGRARAVWVGGAAGIAAIGVVAAILVAAGARPAPQTPCLTGTPATSPAAVETIGASPAVTCRPTSASSRN